MTRRLCLLAALALVAGCRSGAVQLALSVPAVLESAQTVDLTAEISAYPGRKPTAVDPTTSAFVRPDPVGVVGIDFAGGATVGELRLTPGDYFADLVYYHGRDAARLSLLQTTFDFTVSAEATTKVEVTDLTCSFTAFDDDLDGAYNLDEVVMGDDPRDSRWHGETALSSALTPFDPWRQSIHATVLELPAQVSPAWMTIGALAVANDYVVSVVSPKAPSGAPWTGLEQHWSYPLVDLMAVTGNGVVAVDRVNGRLLAAGGAGSVAWVQALDWATGAELWLSRYEVPSALVPLNPAVSAPIVIADGTIYLSVADAATPPTKGGLIHLAADGTELATYPDCQLFGAHAGEPWRQGGASSRAFFFAAADGTCGGTAVTKGDLVALNLESVAGGGVVFGWRVACPSLGVTGCPDGSSSMVVSGGLGRLLINLHANASPWKWGLKTYDLDGQEVMGEWVFPDEGSIAPATLSSQGNWARTYLDTRNSTTRPLWTLKTNGGQEDIAEIPGADVVGSQDPTCGGQAQGWSIYCLNEELSPTPLSGNRFLTLGYPRPTLLGEPETQRTDPLPLVLIGFDGAVWGKSPLPVTRLPDGRHRLVSNILVLDNIAYLVVGTMMAMSSDDGTTILGVELPAL